MELLFYIEASSDIGHGHVMRCAALAQTAQVRGLKTGFIGANRYTENLIGKLKLPHIKNKTSCAEIVIIDYHSSVDPSMVLSLKAQGSTVALLDQKGVARMVADVVCDALTSPDMLSQLPQSAHTKYLYGLDFALLRSQFKDAHATARPGQSTQPRLMVAMGGVDQHLVAPRLAAALAAQGFTGPATFVVENSTATTVHQQAACWKNTWILSDIEDMALQMRQCDLLITKIGGLTLESFCVGLGAVMIEPSLAHVALSNSLAEIYEDWPARSLGLATEVNMDIVAHEVITLLSDRYLLAKMGQRGSELIDGKGCDRLLDELTK